MGRAERSHLVAGSLLRGQGTLKGSSPKAKSKRFVALLTHRRSLSTARPFLPPGLDFLVWSSRLPIPMQVIGAECVPTVGREPSVKGRRSDRDLFARLWLWRQGCMKRLRSLIARRRLGTIHHRLDVGQPNRLPSVGVPNHSAPASGRTRKPVDHHRDI
jgi:hypothetical protein